MKKIIPYIVLAIFAQSCATDRLLKQANSSYDNMEYHVASEKYSEYLQKHKSHEAQIRLAQCEYKMNHYALAEKLYSQVISFPQITAVNKLEYAHTLKHNGKYKEAGSWFAEYLFDNPSDAAVKNEMASCDSLKSFTKLSYEYEILETTLNKEGSNFSPVFYKNGIVFCSDRKKTVREKDVSKWTGHSYLDLYYSDITKDNSFSEPALFSKEINSNYNDGPACFSKDGNTIYFTRNMLSRNNKPEKNAGDVNNFEIYSSEFKNGAWSEPKLVSFDSKEYSVGHPALSGDGSRLYFVSDMPGGLGGTDIYYSEKNTSTGEWGTPVNAGELINTNENEMFPTVYVDKEGVEYLYFSSEGKQGMGGLDIFSSVIVNEELSVNSNGKYSVETIKTIKGGFFTEPSHLTAPLNSSGDDFGIIFNADGTFGYFSSNRNSEEGIDRMYAFKKYIPQFFLEVTIKKKGTDEALPGAKIEIADINHDKLENAIADENGKVFRKIDPNSQLNVLASKDNFFSGRGVIDNIGEIFSDTLKMTLELDAIVINKPIRLDNIYYDYDKWNIRPDAALELDKLVKVLEDNPNIHIELSSHTDSRGSDKYNMTLSHKRAQSAVDYIIANGINKTRIYAMGYGESKLLNRCKNGVKCSEEEHQLNRRTEFAVVKILKPIAEPTTTTLK